MNHFISTLVSIEKIVKELLFLKLFGENKLITSNKSVTFLPLKIKSINPIQKYPLIIESHACILKVFVVMFSLPIKFLISFGMCSANSYQGILPRHHLDMKLPNEFQYICIH